MCDYPTHLNTSCCGQMPMAPMASPAPVVEEIAYARSRGGGGGRHKGGGGRRWHGGGGRRRWHGGGRRNYYSPTYTAFPYSYSYPYSYNYGYSYPYYSYPYYSYPSYSYTAPVVDVETVNVGGSKSSKFGSCVCDGNEPARDFCATGYEASCQKGSCVCVNTNKVKAVLGDWGCGNSSEMYCPIQK